MKKDYRILLDASKHKVETAVNLVEASLSDLEKYSTFKKYSPKELEPYDALSDRFIRAVETCIKFFKTYEYYFFTIKSDTYRDLLLSMVKQKLISSVEIWIDMRDIRNRIVHDYLPGQIKDIFDLIMCEFQKELLELKNKIEHV
ncbi:MAG: nucleotidyltransferase substrate binding protein [Bacteroidetes bacterium]|nr:nucleotidyltransferase substrate binding protein [Bacteroidota bacterium]MBU1677991.1 nucleotidyltransferase substrate binding protein [Bacteroidota bacterium]MBU2508013.1 nucleotidyltransferase substrate binding protein [Bacteroidota bacterium]